MHTWHFALSPFNMIEGENTFITLKMYLKVTGEKRFALHTIFAWTLIWQTKMFVSAIYLFLG